jgi:hypothetical protein
MKESAVEWLVDEHFGGIDNCTPDFKNKIEYAKEIEKKQRLTRQLFIGKVAEIIGFEKTVELLKESEKTINQ